MPSSIKGEPSKIYLPANSLTKKLEETDGPKPLVMGWYANPTNQLDGNVETRNLILVDYYSFENAIETIKSVSQSLKIILPYIDK